MVGSGCSEKKLLRINGGDVWSTTAAWLKLSLVLALIFITTPAFAYPGGMFRTVLPQIPTHRSKAITLQYCTAQAGTVFPLANTATTTGSHTNSDKTTYRAASRGACRTPSGTAWRTGKKMNEIRNNKRKPFALPTALSYLAPSRRSPRKEAPQRLQALQTSTCATSPFN